MKNKVLLTLFVLLAVTVNIAVAQDNSEFERRQQQKQQKETTLQQAADISPTAKVLKAKVEQGDEGAILEAAKTGDQSLKPYLKALAADEQRRTNQNSSAFAAHIALAKLRDDEALQQIFAELKSEDFSVQDSAIAKLALSSQKAAYRKLYELLDDTEPRQSRSSHGFYNTKSVIVMYELGRAVENPPLLANGMVNDRYISAWKAWFAKNKHVIE